MAFKGKRLALTVPLFSAIIATTAHAQAGDCNGFRNLEAETTISLGVVNAGTPRVNFIKSASAERTCPNSGNDCRDKGYLVPGDQVIVSSTEHDFACVDYINAKGLGRAGWLPRSAISPLPDRASGLEDWAGQWAGGPEQAISIKKGSRRGEIKIDGEASYGSLDPERAKRGAVNVGEIEAVVKPAGASLAFTMGDDATLPYDQGDTYDCRVRMRLLDPFLLVEDNGNCGGMNVSFSGAYRRKK
jgi:hypothetical protein